MSVFDTGLLERFRLLALGRSSWEWLAGRWGVGLPGAVSGGVWIHAKGPGEMRVAATLARILPQSLPLVVTTAYRWNLRLGRSALPARAAVTALPFSFPFSIRRFLRRYSPCELILIEASDLRPLLYLDIARRELPTALVNGWLNPRLLRNGSYLALLRDKVQAFGVRSEHDEELLIRIGIPQERILVTGDLKFDAVVAPCPELAAHLRALADGRPILVAGSTHPREEPEILDAFERLGGGRRAMLILAPRFPANFRWSQRLLQARGVGFARRSLLPASGRPAVILLDRMGELASLYRLATAAFVGWSLVRGGGGQSPLEAASSAVPIAAGPNMGNFPAIMEMFDRADAWRRVADAGELAQAWGDWLSDPGLAQQLGRRAADLVESQRGLAIARTLELLRSFLGPARATELSLAAPAARPALP